MDKIFATENGKVYVLQGGQWYECVLTINSVEAFAAADVELSERYNLTEIRAKCASLIKMNTSGIETVSNETVPAQELPQGEDTTNIPDIIPPASGADKNLVTPEPKATTTKKME